MNRELLEKPFDKNQIKQREGNFGKMLDYIEGHSVIQRLNDAFDADWSFAVLKHEVLKETDEVIVLGEISAGPIIKTQFGASRITRSRETGDIISLSDDLKAAATDALKKCATLLGIGLHLYNGDKPKRQNNGERNRSNSGSRNTNGGNGNGNGRLTGKQYKYIMRLNDGLGRSKAELDQYALEMFGTVSQHLSKSDASALINNLLAQ